MNTDDEDPRITANRVYAELARAAEAQARREGREVDAVFVYAPLARAHEAALARLTTPMTEAQARVIATCATCGLSVASHDTTPPFACTDSACEGFISRGNP